MDLNYDLRTWDISLRKISLIKVTQHLVETAKLDHCPTTKPAVIISRATKRAQKLELPTILMTEIKNIIRPIMDEMQAWYEMNGYNICPILTPHGTLDFEKSARALMEYGDQSTSFLFNLACCYCMEEEIVHFGSRLTDEEKYHQHPPPMSLFWCDVYRGQFVQKITKNDLSIEQCKKGFLVASRQKSKMTMIPARKYFSEKLSQADIEGHEYYRYLSYNVCANIFRSVEDVHNNDMSSMFMLKALLNWPYQHLFLEAAQTLTAKLTTKQCLEVAIKITKKAAMGYQDYNYKGLFISFWKMGLENKYNGMYLFKYFVLLDNAFLMQDKDIAFMVLDQFNDTSQLFIGNFFCRFNCTYAKLIYSKKYEGLRFPMYVLKQKHQQLYLFFKKKYEDMCTCNITKHQLFRQLFSYKTDFISTEQWYVNLKEFVRLLSEWETSDYP